MGGPSKPTTQRRTFSRPTRTLNESRNTFQGRDEHALNSINDHLERQPDAFDLASKGEETIPKEHENLSEETATTNEGTNSKEHEILNEETATEDAQEAETVPHVPWYLQQQTQERVEESPLAQRQRLPDLPDHAPQLLQPLLEHVSIELGMDDLTLLDMRELDPPPALGSNLLMIIGTARSEKHLHVSADRLCRWLRTEYKMSPFADGLLGRNELKLKMRRKAKRARLMSAVGSQTTSDNADDGIRTGWVCVNVGKVNDGELPEDRTKVQRMEGMVGFGAHTTGSNIVVQMLTEEKRGEVDLEKLWTGIINRARKQKEKEVEDARIEASPVEKALRDAQPETMTYTP